MVLLVLLKQIRCLGVPWAKDKLQLTIAAFDVANEGRRQIWKTGPRDTPIEIGLTQDGVTSVPSGHFRITCNTTFPTEKFYPSQHLFWCMYFLIKRKHSPCSRGKYQAKRDPQKIREMAPKLIQQVVWIYETTPNQTHRKRCLSNMLPYGWIQGVIISCLVGQPDWNSKLPRAAMSASSACSKNVKMFHSYSAWRPDKLSKSTEIHD